jgi:anti-sigma regulatory factor (Ser/Thr protein kinase)
MSYVICAVHNTFGMFLSRETGRRGTIYLTSTCIRATTHLPVYERLRRLFVNCGWPHLIAPKQFPDSGQEVGDNIPLLRFVDQSQQDQIVNLTVDILLRTLSFLTRDDLRALEWSVNEICDNVLNHAESEIGRLFQFNMRRFSREVEFIVADAGMGIPNSLRSSGNREWSDEFALEQSIKQGVTRDPKFGQGNGLFGTYQIAALSGGTFHINAGAAHLVVTRKGEVQVRRDPEEFHGTMVLCAINFTKPELLERALSFKGNNYRMVDLIEMRYEQDDDTLKIWIRDEAESCGSRRSGFAVRTKIKNLLKFGPQTRLVCDMDGVGIMSSSFADEVFGKLAGEFGWEAYKQRIAVINATRINAMLIGRAIDQRLQGEG